MNTIAIFAKDLRTARRVLQDCIDNKKYGEVKSLNLMICDFETPIIMNSLQ